MVYAPGRGPPPPPPTKDRPLPPPPVRPRPRSPKRFARPQSKSARSLELSRFFRQSAARRESRSSCPPLSLSPAPAPYPSRKAKSQQPQWPQPTVFLASDPPRTPQRVAQKKKGQPVSSPVGPRVLRP